MANGRLDRAKAIVANGEIVVDSFVTNYPGAGTVKMGAFECQSQSRPGLTHKGGFMYNGHIVEEETWCDCEDWANGNFCMHAQAALLEDGANLQEVLQ